MSQLSGFLKWVSTTFSEKLEMIFLPSHKQESVEEISKFVLQKIF